MARGVPYFKRKQSKMKRPIIHPIALLLPAVFLCVTVGLQAQTGTAVPELATIDRRIPALMKKWSIPGGAVAIAKDGKLVFARGYGVADKSHNEPVQPDSLFRIGSVSKTLTSAGVLTLVEEGRLNLDDKVFQILSYLQPPPGRSMDPRLHDITVRQLLQHTGGWDRMKSGDPTNPPYTEYAAAALHVPYPPSFETVVRYMLGQPLDFTPGTEFQYSNFGVDLLGLIIEKTASQQYETYIQQRVLSPMGITRVAAGLGSPEERLPKEVVYYDYPHAPLVRSIYPNVHRLMPRPYAVWQMEHGMVPAGGWIASAIDLVLFNSRLDGARPPALLRPSTIQLMFEPPPAPPLLNPKSDYWYGLGWEVSPYNSTGTLNWWHGGYFPGSRADLVRLGNGVVFAALFNSDCADANGFTAEFEAFLVDASLNTQTWPTHDLFSNYYPGE